MRVNAVGDDFFCYKWKKMAARWMPVSLGVRRFSEASLNEA
jgi:hypothetical protein